MLESAEGVWLCCVKMDVSTKEAATLALKNHTAMAVRQIVSAVGVGKSIAARTITAHEASISLSPQPLLELIYLYTETAKFIHKRTVQTLPRFIG